MGGFLPLQAGCFHALRPHNCKLKIGNAKLVFITGPHATFFIHTDFALKFLAMKKMLLQETIIFVSNCKP